VANLGRLAPGVDWSRASALAPHERIVASARGLGFGQVILVPMAAAALAQAAAAHARRSIQSGAP
jgi:hypothetical protein